MKNYSNLILNLLIKDSSIKSPSIKMSTNTLPNPIPELAALSSEAIIKLMTSSFPETMKSPLLKPKKNSALLNPS